MNKRTSINGRIYWSKTERHWGMWDMIRIVAQFTPTIKPSMLTPALTRDQAAQALRHLAKRGELVRVKLGSGSLGRWGHNQEPVYKVKQ